MNEKGWIIDENRWKGWKGGKGWVKIKNGWKG